MLRFIALFFVILIFSAPARAEFDFSRTINLAGKQRMLTQKMAKEALLVALGVDKEKNISHLKATYSLFDKTLKGLRNGDEGLGLSPVKKQKIQSQLDIVTGLWEGYGAAISAIMNSGSASEPDIDLVASLNVPVLSAMNHAVKLYEYEAEGGGLSSARAATINIAGRQRMLTQKMSKEYLLIVQGKHSDRNTSSLKGTMYLFDTSLNGLIDGDPSLGISPAPTPELKAQLEKVRAMWGEFKALIERTPSQENIRMVADKNVSLLKEMNAAVSMFEAFSTVPVSED